MVDKNTRRGNGDRVERRPEKKRFEFHYEPRKQEDMEQHANRRTSRFDTLFDEKFREFRAHAGANYVRILPATWKNKKHYGFEFWAHRFVGSENGNYPCPRKMKDQRCSVCEAHRIAVKDGDEEEARKLAVKNVFAYWVIDREADSANKNRPQIWVVTNLMDKDIMGLTLDRQKKSFLYIEHPEQGYDLSFNREGQGLSTRYTSFQFDRDPSPISRDGRTQDSILEFITEHPLPDLLHWYDADHLDSVMFGTADDHRDEDLDAEEDESPRRPRHEDEPEEEQDETDEHEGGEQDEERGEEEDEEERGDQEEEETQEAADEDEQTEDEEDPEVRPRRRLPEREPARASRADNGRGRERPGDRGDRPRGTIVARRPGKDRPTKNYNR
jgi:hypothetical protein